MVQQGQEREEEVDGSLYNNGQSSCSPTETQTDCKSLKFQIRRRMTGFLKKADLDMDTFLRMMKGALAPVIVLAM